MPSNHLILCCPLLLLPSVFPSIGIFSNESALHIRWPKYWSFSSNISPSNEHPGLISSRMDWLNLLAVRGTLKSLLQTTVQKHQFIFQRPPRSSWETRRPLSHPHYRRVKLFTSPARCLKSSAPGPLRGPSALTCRLPGGGLAGPLPGPGEEGAPSRLRPSELQGGPKAFSLWSNMSNEAAAGQGSISHFCFSNTQPLFNTQFNSVTQSCLTLCDHMDYNTSDLSVHHHLPEFTQTHMQ